VSSLCPSIRSPEKGTEENEARNDSRSRVNVLGLTQTCHRRPLLRDRTFYRLIRDRYSLQATEQYHLERKCAVDIVS
jgi:hypothetical protein